MLASSSSYYLASAAQDSVVKLWDLRKLNNFKTLELDQDYQVSNSPRVGIGVNCGGVDLP